MQAYHRVSLLAWWILAVISPPATRGLAVRETVRSPVRVVIPHPGVVSADKAGFAWSCDFGWEPFNGPIDRAGESMLQYTYRITAQNAAYESPSHNTFRFFENKLSEHEYFRQCQMPHVPVHDMGYFDPAHGPEFADHWLDRPYPYIARFAAEGMSRGTFKIDNDADKRELRQAIRVYKANLKANGETHWGLQNPREGVLLSELVTGATEISAYVSFGMVGTIWWRVDEAGKDVANWSTWKFMNMYARGTQVECLDWQQNGLDHAQCTPAHALEMTQMLPQMQRLANKVVLDWKVPWFRLDLFLLPDGEMLINELSFPGHMVNDGRDTARFDRMLANASRCSTPPEPYYECSGEAESRWTDPADGQYTGEGEMVPYPYDTSASDGTGAGYGAALAFPFDVLIGIVIGVIGFAFIVTFFPSWMNFAPRPRSSLRKVSKR